MSESEIIQESEELVRTVRPQTDTILQKMESEVARLKRHEQNLSYQIKLQQERLQQLKALQSKDSADTTSSYSQKQDYEEEEKVQLERLQAELDRLKYSKSLADLQKKRKKSMSHLKQPF